jgi:hypothetical protein
MKTFSLIFFSLVLMACQTLHPTLHPYWISDVNSSCQVWNPAPVSDESIKWTGSCSNGKATGKGILQWYRNGKPTGRYEGQYRNGHMDDGKGLYVFANGDVYEGDFVDGKRTGKGKDTLHNGDVYEGEFVDSEWNGKGDLYDSKGWKLTGKWIHGKLYY